MHFYDESHGSPSFLCIAVTQPSGNFASGLNYVFNYIWIGSNILFLLSPAGWMIQLLTCIQKLLLGDSSPFSKFEGCVSTSSLS